MPPIVVSLINLKGGVGKTTTTVQLAECLVSEFSKRVLVIDLDPQTNATIALISETAWEDLDQKGRTIYQMFRDKIEGTKHFNMKDAIVRSVSNLKLDRLHLLASSIRLIDVQDRMNEIAVKSGYAISPMEVLKQEIQAYLGHYDYILVDCPPNLGFITRNGIEISDFYLIPTIPDTLSTYGIPQIVSSIHRFTKERQIKIRCLGLVITKFYSRAVSHQRGLANLPAKFANAFTKLGLPPAPVFKSVIPLTNSFADATLVSNEHSTFAKKYGYNQIDGLPLHAHIRNLTKEFMDYAGI